MHEAGVMNEILKVAQAALNENETSQVKAIVLQVGELSGVVPEYLTYYYPLLVGDYQGFEESELVIEKVDGIVKCLDCGHQYDVIKREGYCPECSSFNKEIISGRELMIKELLVI